MVGEQVSEQVPDEVPNELGPHGVYSAFEYRPELTLVL